VSSTPINIREANNPDIPGMFLVRTSITENLLNAQQLAKMGITTDSVAASLQRDCKAWVAEDEDRIVAFSIADRSVGSIFALFVLLNYENRGLGSRLLDSAVGWLANYGVNRVWLTTAPHTKAAKWYAKRGWRHAGTESNGELRLELQLID
jgi:GNAT superfamily N-acetyltransferase